MDYKTLISETDLKNQIKLKGLNSLILDSICWQFNNHYNLAKKENQLTLVNNQKIMVDINNGIYFNAEVSIKNNEENVIYHHKYGLKNGKIISPTILKGMPITQTGYENTWAIAKIESHPKDLL